MMKARKKLIVALALLLVTSGSAFALGLGQIKVKSALNQPLVAEIPVVSATSAELRGLKVSLASSEDFQRAGINRARLQTPLKFKVEKRNGSTVIVVTSEEPVSDPALDLLLELNWSNGKLLREYSVLLDPPGMPAAHTSRSVATTTAAKGSASARTKSTRKTNVRKSAPKATPMADTGSRAPASATPTVKMGSDYTARAGDSVWSIARRSTAHAGSINRMMVAIQRANPDAFYKDNINALKKGAVLRIPDRAELARVSAGDARAEVRQQNQVWSNPGAASPSMMASSDRTRAATRTGSAAPSDSRLELVPPGGNNSSGSGRTGVAGGSGQAAVAGLKQELSRAKESLASEKQRSEDMTARVKDLEGIRDSNQRLLKLKNAQIAQLQDNLAKAKANAAAGTESSKPLRKDIFEPGEGGSTAAAPEPVAAASVASMATAGSATLAAAGSVPANAGTSESAAQTAMATSTATPEAAMASTAAPAVAAVTPEPTATQPASEAPTPTTKPWYMQTWAWIIGGLVILGLILFGLLGRRGKSEGGRQERLSGALASGSDDTDDGLVDDSEDEYALLEEIEQHPDELSLHLELASLYYAHRNQDKFEGAAEAMYAHVDDPEQPEWQQVRAMGEELCPDHPLFAELHSDGQAPVDSDSALAAMVGEDDAHGDDAGSDDDARGYNFDFDLTPVADGEHDSDDDQADMGDEHEVSTTSEDEDLLSLSTLESSQPADDTETPPVAEEFDIDQIQADAATEQAEEATAEDVGIQGADLDSDDSEPASAEEEFSSDPVDTKLDLARAYQDMGDEEGARAMLEEVLQEGSESQKDVARKLLDDLG